MFELPSVLHSSPESKIIQRKQILFTFDRTHAPRSIWHSNDILHHPNIMVPRRAHGLRNVRDTIAVICSVDALECFHGRFKKKFKHFSVGLTNSGAIQQ